MKLTWETWALACIVVSAILIVATIVIKVANDEQCSTFQVSRYNEMMRLMRDFRFKTPACRFTAQAIAKYKIEALDDPAHVANTWKLNDFTDYALYALVAGDALKDTSRLLVFNDPTFADIAADYDASANTFYKEDSRALAEDLILKYIDTEDKKKALSNELKNMTSNQVFDLLIRGTKS
ncbi:hypothetical protein PHYPSEUDO_013284 [Phytophthora pseudosyringae]|uniref:Uncharacterized protein n=1 Tax=Phytophthora pseudosyringae TaxID=221518 RepID=A0A8T1V5G9_9STRA|nr:hypothetical protein PHYPSEUDO_013284 [Phytophthora pseudosyringae]